MTTTTTERAILAGGCFWILQELLRHPDGVIATRVGWMGGTGDHPSEADSGGHAEVVEVTFHPRRLSYRGLLEYFFMVHRADLGAEVVGSIYRSEIFATSAVQERVAQEIVGDVDRSGHWPGPVTTRVSRAGRFWPEPADQQDYLQRLARVRPAHVAPSPATAP
jgi:peptide-methionine (S)-S-oxide reductase